MSIAFVSRSRQVRRVALATLLVVVASLASGCQAFAPPATPEAQVPWVDIVLHPVEVRPPKDITTQATDVLAVRLRTIGIGNFNMSAGDDITVSVGATEDLAMVRAVLLATGEVAFGALPANGDLPAVGSAFAVAAPLWPGDEIEQASTGPDENGAMTVNFVLTPAGAAAFAAFSQAHVGESFVITLDGIVIAAPVVVVPITDGHVAISFGDPSLVPAVVLRAILVSGPLPNAWRQR